uniref:Uncharacterized protein n=1 Tax=Schlesneria paludicola TaxID=360056 RepID=A0A7C2P2S2_9PLAN
MVTPVNHLVVKKREILYRRRLFPIGRPPAIGHRYGGRNTTAVRCPDAARETVNSLSRRETARRQVGG